MVILFKGLTVYRQIAANAICKAYLLTFLCVMYSVSILRIVEGAYDRFLCFPVISLLSLFYINIIIDIGRRRVPCFGLDLGDVTISKCHCMTISRYEPCGTMFFCCYSYLPKCPDDVYCYVTGHVSKDYNSNSHNLWSEVGRVPEIFTQLRVT